MRLRRIEGFKYVGRFLGINSRSCVPYFNADCVAAVTFGFHFHYSTVIVDHLHGFYRVLYQIDNYLLQLTTVARDKRQFRCEIDAGGNIVILKFSVQSA